MFGEMPRRWKNSIEDMPRLARYGATCRKLLILIDGAEFNIQNNLASKGKTRAGGL
jgi:hypothetical protein